MPHLDASALTTDPEGLDFLRTVLATDDGSVAPTVKAAFIPAHVPTPASPIQRDHPFGRPHLALADAA